MPTLEETFRDLSITNIKKKNQVTMNCKFSDVLELINMKDHLNFENRANRDAFTNPLSKSKSGWRGGSIEELKSDLEGRRNMKPYFEIRKRLEETGVLQALKTIIEKVRPKRSRLYSEHDGDWDMSRQWDILPFHSTTRSLAEGSFIDIEANFGVNSQASAEDLDSYGALVWAISDLIEQCGVCTRIIYRLDPRNVSSSGRTDVCIRIVVKDTGQYVAPPILAAVFTSNFFRRFGFSTLAMSMEHIGQEISGGYGSQRSHDKSIDFENGIVKTWADLHQEPEKMVRVLLKAFEPRGG